jgi:hypothetical protein
VRRRRTLRCAGADLFTAVFGVLDDLERACTENDDFYRSNDNDRFSWTAGVYGFCESGTGKLNVPFWEAGALGNPAPSAADAPLFDLPLFPGATFGQFATGLAATISRRQEVHATNKSMAVYF